MSKKSRFIALSVFSTVFGICFIMYIVLFFITYSDSCKLKFITNNLDKWDVYMLQENALKNLGITLRGNLLHELMRFQKSSRVLKQEPETMIYKKWTPFPVQTNGRSNYNPTWSALHKVALFRNDDIPCLWESIAYYDRASVVLDQVTDLPLFIPPISDNRIKFVSDGRTYDKSRSEVSTTARVIEDLRFAVEWNKNLDPNRDRLPLVTGTSLYAIEKSDVCVMQGRASSVLSENPVIHWIHDIPSPRGVEFEKNWLFIQDFLDVNVFNVIYSAQPFLIYRYRADVRTMDTKPFLENEFPEPSQWKKIPSPMSEYRLSAAALVRDESLLMVLLHRRCTTARLYLNYCIYLDPRSFAPLYYIPFPVMTEVSIKVVFPLSVTCTRTHYHIACGLEDTVAGILTYDVDKWEKNRLAWL